MATTSHSIEWTGEDEIEKHDSKPCARVKRAKEVVLSIKSDYADDMLDKPGGFTKSGLGALVDHESRRVSARYKGHAEYLLRVSGAGGEAKKCGWVSASSSQEAESKLKTFLSDQRDLATSEFKKYVARQDKNITDEMISYELVGPNRNIINDIISPADVEEPNSLNNWTPCP